jgi:hypothetical protein
VLVVAGVKAADGKTQRHVPSGAHFSERGCVKRWMA